MSEKDKKTLYNLEYAKKSLKRIPLDVQKEKYAEIQSAATAAGETVNGYIKKAIDERMERDSSKPAANANYYTEKPDHAPAASLESQSNPSPEDIANHVDFKKLAADVRYQIEIGRIVGMDELAKLLEKSRELEAAE